MEPFWISGCRIDPARNVIGLGAASCGQINRWGRTSSCEPKAGEQNSGRGSELYIEPKLMALLCALAEKPGEVVSRAALLDQIWYNQVVADETLTRAISALRKTFRKCIDEAVIETIPKRGYRLIPNVRAHVRANVRVESPADGSGRESIVSPQSRPQNSIAVLAFVDLSQEQDREHLADGVAEEILNALAQMAGLKVSGRTSSFSFKRQNVDIRDIASTLNVAHVLEGSLRVQGSTARITAQLIDADGYHLWSQTYDRDLKDIFKLQEEIARSITQQIVGLLPESDQQAPVPTLTPSSAAYEAFVQGRDLTHRLNGQTTIPTGIDFLTRAVELDPKFADAWAWLGLAHFILPEFSQSKHWESHIDQSRDAIDRALEIEPQCSIALLVLALQTMYDHKVDEAIAIYERALQIDPNNIETVAGYGLGMMAIGHHNTARQQFDRVLEQDPLCGLWHTVYGGILLGEGEFAESEHWFRTSFELGFGAAAFGVAHRLAQRGRKTEALEFLESNYAGLAPVEQAELRMPMIRRLVYNAYLGRRRAARFLTATAMRRRLKNRQAQPTSASVISFLFLEEPQAFFDNILEKPNPYLGYTIARIWEPTRQSRLIREHPAFPAFTRALGLDRAWASYGPTPILGNQAVRA